MRTSTLQHKKRFQVIPIFRFITGFFKEPKNNKMNHLKYTFLITFSFFSIATIFAQNDISLTTFLSSASQQKNVQIANQQLEFQAGQDAELPWIQELEFRTETNDFILKQQEYAVRVTPNTKRQRNAQSAFHQATAELSKTERELVLKNALFLRYEWLVEWLEIEKSLEQKAVLKVIYDDKLVVLKRSVGNLDFKVKDLVKAEEDLLEIDLKIRTLNNKKARLLNEFQYLVGANNRLLLDKNTLITTSQILDKITFQTLDSTNSLALVRKQKRMELLDKETEIELSEIHNPISYAQIKAGGNGDDFREFVSVGIGIKFSLKGDKKLDLNELDFEKFEESGEYILLKERLEYRQNQLIARLNQLILQQEYLETQLKNSQATFLLNKLLEIDGSNPLDILDLKEIIIKKEQNIEQIDLQILSIYVEWLAVSNKMMERPFRNHLVNDLDILPIENRN